MYCDECVRLDLAPLLRRRGFVVTTMVDSGLAGASDDVQLAHATRTDVVIVTYDAQDYLRLHTQGNTHGGMVLVRNTRLDWQEIRVAMPLDWAASLDDHRSQTFRWHGLQQRLIGGERLPGYSEDEVRRALGHG